MELMRRELLGKVGKFLVLSGAALEALESPTGAVAADSKYNMADHWWAMTIDINKCIGCGNCVRACAAENDVPDGFFRTWIERYQVNPLSPLRTKVTALRQSGTRRKRKRSGSRRDGSVHLHSSQLCCAS